MNDVSSLLALLQPQIIESKVSTLEKKVGIKSKKLPRYHLISFDKKINNQDIEKFIKQIEKFYTASQNELNRINNELQNQIEIFNANNQKEKQKIEDENLILQRKLNETQQILDNIISPNAENIARYDFLIEKTRNNITLLDQKSIKYQIEYNHLNQRIPILKQRISKKNRDRTSEITSLREKIDNLKNVYIKYNSTSRNLWISTKKQNNILIEDKIRGCCQQLQSICKEKQKYFFKIREMHRIKDETHKITVKKNKFVKNEKKIENYVSHKRLQRLKDKNKKTKETLHKWKKVHHKAISKQKKLEIELKHVKQGIRNEDEKTEFMEDVLFGDTEHKIIELTNKIPINLEIINIPANHFVEVDNLKKEIDNDINQLEINIQNENKDILLLKQKINECILSKMEGFDINNFDYDNIIPIQQNKLKIEELEWKIQHLKKENNIKKAFLSSVNYDDNNQILELTPSSLAVLKANIEMEISKWNQLNQQGVASELSKWHEQITDILKYNSAL